MGVHNRDSEDYNQQVNSASAETLLRSDTKGEYAYNTISCCTLDTVSCVLSTQATL